MDMVEVFSCIKD
jgi:hypothetical protein